MIKKILIVVSVLFSLTSCVMSEQNKLNKIDEYVDNSDLYQTVNTNLKVVNFSFFTKKGEKVIKVEIADNYQSRMVGLMNRTSLLEESGMLFIFEEQGFLNFWMKNTLIPLDMIFINQEGVIEHIAKNVQPCRGLDEDCPKISSVKPVRYVVEVNGSMADKWGIEVGDKIHW